MEWCTNSAYSADPSDNIGRCIMHSVNLACTTTANVSERVSKDYYPV